MERMKCLPIAFVFIFLGLWGRQAWAEGRCPDGYFPTGGGDAGWEGCAPMGPDSDQGPHDQPSWETRGGAVAVTNGAFGYSYSYATEERAISEALSNCSQNADGATCQLKQSYHDQCIALAWGKTGSNSVAAPDIAQAEGLALENCSRRNQDCKIYYSGCSYPERVR